LADGGLTLKSKDVITNDLSYYQVTKCARIKTSIWDRTALSINTIDYFTNKDTRHLTHATQFLDDIISQIKTWREQHKAMFICIDANENTSAPEQEA